MATLQYFVLDSNASGYADALTALATVTASNLGYTPTQVLRSASHDSTIKIVAALCDEADLTGDLAVLHEDNAPNALCLDRFIDLQDRRERLFPLLGEMERTPYPELTVVEYICPDGVNTSGTEDGMTPWTGWNGPRSLNINGGASRTMQGGIRYIACRGVIHKSSSAFSTTANGNISFADASATERVELACDHPVWPSVILGTFTHTPSGAKGDPWVHEGNNIYSQADWGNGTQTPFQSALIVTSAVDPEASLEWNMENAIYIKGGSETDLEPGEWFTSDGIKMYVHMLDSQAPPSGFNISNRWDGLGGYYLDTENGKNIKLNNVRHFAAGITSNRIAKCTNLTVAGGQFALHSGAGGGDYFLLVNADHWKFCAATYGRLVYDRSDIVFDGEAVDKDHRLVRELIETKGSSEAAFADMDMWCCLHHVQNGPGLNNNTATNKDNIDGLYVVDCNAIVSNTRGTISSHLHDDGHGLSGRNGNLNDRVWQRFVLLRGGRHYDFYVSADGEGNAPYSGSGTNCANNISQDFLILGDNGRANADDGKAQCGIGWEHDNDSVLYMNGTGVKTGNIFRRFAISGLLSDDMTSAAISLVNEQEMQFLNYIVENCNYHYQMARSFQESVPYVAIVRGGVVTEVTENLLLDTGGGVATTLDLDVGDYIIFGSMVPFRRVEPLITTGASGTYTLAFEERITGSTWQAVSDLSDGSSSLSSAHATNRRIITWTKNDDMEQGDFDTATGLYYFRIRLASGSFSTDPIISRVAGRQIGSVLYSRGATVRDLALGWDDVNSGSYPTNSGYVDVDDFTLRLLSGQTVDTATIFNEGNHTFAQWKAQTSGFYVVKDYHLTDGVKSSNHGSNVTADDIEEVP